MKARRPRNDGRSAKLDRVILAIIILLVVAAIGAMTFRLFATNAASASASGSVLDVVLDAVLDAGATFRHSHAAH